jgi:hypothetical protein
VLTTRSRQLLAEASVVAEAPGSSYDASKRRQPGSAAPSGKGRSLYEAVAHVLGCRLTDQGVLVQGYEPSQKRIEDAEKMIRDAKRAKVRPELTMAQRRHWIALAPRSRPNSEVAAEYEVTVELVSQIRDRKPRSRGADVRRLAAEGRSSREIAATVGCSQSTVVRELRDAV